MRWAWHEPKVATISPGFTVRRSLPFGGGKGVGPFVFLDHMGPVTRIVSGEHDVGPHPHIGLATVTYLFSGELFHRDSLGTAQKIIPGEVNWMSAGKGIVHSERAPVEQYGQTQTLHGLQIWVALPPEQEESEPSFQHVKASDLPQIQKGSLKTTIVVGEAFGVRSPVRAQEGLLYCAVEATGDTVWEWPRDEREFGFYLVDGTVHFEGQEFRGPGLLRFEVDPMAQIKMELIAGSRGVWLGGAPLVQHRRIWWNFVSTRKERIEVAKQEWREDRFPKIPGETERVPLPGESL